MACFPHRLPSSSSVIIRSHRTNSLSVYFCGIDCLFGIDQGASDIPPVSDSLVNAGLDAVVTFCQIRLVRFPSVIKYGLDFVEGFQLVIIFVPSCLADGILTS